MLSIQSNSQTISNPSQIKFGHTPSKLVKKDPIFSFDHLLHSMMYKCVEVISGNKEIPKIIKHLIERPTLFQRQSETPLFQSPFTSHELAKIHSRLKSFPERPWMKDSDYTQKKMEIVQEIFEEIHKLTKDRPELKEVREMMMAEILSKEFAGLDASIGQKMRLPIADESGTCKLVEFIVSYKIQLEGTSIPVVALTPQEEGFSPIVLFRSTSPYLKNEGGLRSTFENLDPKGCARGIYEKTLPKFAAMMDKLGSARVIGYSQGGALAQRFIVDFHSMLSRKETSIVFNAPAVEKDYKLSWDQIPEKSRPRVLNFVVTHDIVSKTGSHFIGTVLEIEPKERGDLLSPHFDFKLFEEGWKLFAVDEWEESISQDRKVLRMILTSREVTDLYRAFSERFSWMDAISGVLAPIDLIA